MKSLISKRDEIEEQQKHPDVLIKRTEGLGFSISFIQGVVAREGCGKLYLHVV